MAEISERELLRQLREVIELLAADGTDQLAWLTAEDVPADELMLQLDDVVPAWLPRLQQAGLIPVQAAGAIQNLLDLLHSLRWDSSLWQDAAVNTRAEWKRIRGLAHEALSELPTPRDRGQP